MHTVLLWVVVVLLALTLPGLWFVLYQLVRQQGRVLLRLDDIEDRLALLDHGAASPVRGRNGAQAEAGGTVEEQGLPVGATVPSFQLPDLEGHVVGVEDFRGKAVLLTHWSPECGFCDLIAPELAQLQGDLRKRSVELVLVSYGDAEANRTIKEEHGLECPILLQTGAETLEAFQGLGTPVAYLLDEQGRVAKPLAFGADEVPALAREAARRRKKLRGEKSLSESRIEREGLKAGTPAPTFSLPDVEGRRVSLEDYRGRSVLLVFTDPDCGPCDALAPELVRLHEKGRDDGLALVMVGRGDPEENRKKAREHGLPFPLVLQDRWKLSKAYGIFTTPVAFLIGEGGVIERNVATGAEQILALAREGLGAGKERRYGRRALR